MGQYVQTLVLTGCQGLGSTQLRQLLVLCPNVRYLDVSYTPVGDCSFKRYRPVACLWRPGSAAAETRGRGRNCAPRPSHKHQRRFVIHSSGRNSSYR